MTLAVYRLDSGHPPIYQRSQKHNMHSYFGYSSIEQDGPLLLLGIKDPSRLTLDSLRGTSGDAHVGLQTARGFSKVCCVSL